MVKIAKSLLQKQILNPIGTCVLIFDQNSKSLKKKKSQAAKGKKKTFRFTRVLALVYIKNIQLLINVTIIAENNLTKIIADKHLYFSRVQ